MRIDEHWWNTLLAILILVAAILGVGSCLAVDAMRAEGRGRVGDAPGLRDPVRPDDLHRARVAGVGGVRLAAVGGGGLEPATAGRVPELAARSEAVSETYLANHIPVREVLRALAAAARRPRVPGAGLAAVAVRQQPLRPAAALKGAGWWLRLRGPFDLWLASPRVMAAGSGWAASSGAAMGGFKSWPEDGRGFIGHRGFFTAARFRLVCGFSIIATIRRVSDPIICSSEHRLRIWPIPQRKVDSAAQPVKLAMISPQLGSCRASILGVASVTDCATENTTPPTAAVILDDHRLPHPRVSPKGERCAPGGERRRCVTALPPPKPQTPRDIVRAVLEREGLAGYWPAWDCIIQAESGWDPYEIGAAGERGLTQVHPVHFGWVDEARLFDPEYNMEIALVLWRASGWRPWTTRWKCGL